MTEYDVIVVGGGPIGSVAARYAAINGSKTLILEDHAFIGSPVGCTGLLSTRAVSECEIGPSDSSILNSVRGAFIHPMQGDCLPVDGKKTKAYVVSRKIFDRKLAAKALEEDVDLWLNSRVTGIERSQNKQKVSVVRSGEKQVLKAKVVIGADGVRSQIAKWSGLGNVIEVLPGIQAEVPYQSDDTNFVELFLGSQVPGFFGWTVPVNESISRVGMAVDPKYGMPAHRVLENLLTKNKHVASRYSAGKLDLVMGGIPLGPLEKTYSDGVIIVGDAAGQVKPTSGGGIYTGAVCAKIAGEIAAKAAEQENSSASFLSEYDRQWRAKLGKELAMGMRIHRFAAGLKDKEIDELIGSMNNSTILDTITRYGDMDHPSILIKKMLHPSKSVHMLKIFRAFAKAVL
ncbi:geranylgeranyl reductase family [Methanolobus vulcani]|jgi:geranylgeranyl reductase family|uniref:Geranylgeranyl reductase family n=2 Tax=Methanolobus vulcani TaxID=38026 RepID=A0A7Z7FDH3_9EURY|nr:NAD(P)/FAD-dependent oxidoreductase [Methanolobus vulcani]SDF35904.1 geranylgeranyl reductase family [Methanolobus vulcani]